MTDSQANALAMANSLVGWYRKIAQGDNFALFGADALITSYSGTTEAFEALTDKIMLDKIKVAVPKGPIIMGLQIPTPDFLYFDFKFICDVIHREFNYPENHVPCNRFLWNARPWPKTFRWGVSDNINPEHWITPVKEALTICAALEQLGKHMVIAEANRKRADAYILEAYSKALPDREKHGELAGGESELNQKDEEIVLPGSWSTIVKTGNRKLILNVLDHLRTQTVADIDTAYSYTPKKTGRSTIWILCNTIHLLAKNDKIVVGASTPDKCKLTASLFGFDKVSAQAFSKAIDFKDQDSNIEGIRRIIEDSNQTETKQ